MDGSGDSYRDSAEFIDVMSRQAWEQLGPLLAEALAGVDPTAGPVVDVGAGSGLGTEVIARALPEAEILAVEPSPGLRGVLLARLMSTDELRQRVTVLPCDLATARLPERLGAAVAMNMLGHLDPVARRGLWSLLAERLAPGGRAVVNLLPPLAPTEVPNLQSAGVAIGQHLYEGWARAEPAGPDALTWHMTYRVFDGRRVIRSVRADYHWWVLDGRQLAEELADQGLTATTVGPDDAHVYLVTREG
jgi:SAM-dependent methyltransferase